jgi:hypothetical protein
MIAFNFLSYMENEIAAKLKDISHTSNDKRFYKISGIAGLEEYLAELPEVNGTSLMAVENQEGSITANASNYVDNPAFEFYIAQKYEFNNHTERAAVKANCKAIGQKIIAKMLEHKQARLHGLDLLQLDSVPYYTIGPFGDRAIAVYFRFEINTSAKLVVNANDWL